MLSKALHDRSGGAVVYDYKESFRCCGIQHKNWILTSGLILCSYISTDDIEFNNNRCWSSNSEYDSDWGLKNLNFLDTLKRRLRNKEFKVLLNNDLNSGSKTVDNKKTSVGLVEINNGKPNLTEDLLSFSTAYPLSIFRSSLVNQYVTENFISWQLCTNQEHFDDFSSDLIQNLLSIFVILEIGDPGANICFDDTPLKYFLKLCKYGQNYHRGLDIVVESSPFAVPQFYNSWSKGIISNHIGSKDCLFFTDTRLVIGCVGAPVYRFKQGRKEGLVGMILNPMLWSQGEWAGFSVGVNLHIVLTEVLNQNSNLLNSSIPKEIFPSEFVAELDKAVVLVRYKHNWGSGVIVNRKLGIIITCAHVVNYGEGKIVSIACGNYKTIAKVIYSSMATEVFDIAVLKTEPLLHLQDLSLVHKAPRKGETVYCVGFPMVDTERVTLSKGVIANIVPNVLIQTTCCVQSGASGGAIVNSSGGLLGIPVSNMSCAATLALYPHCNLAIPTSSFVDILTHYFKTNDISSLKNLTSQNPVVIKEWALQHKCKI